MTAHVVRYASVVVPLALAASIASAQVIRTVAVSGEPAPGAPAGVLFNLFQNPAIDAQGNTAFSAGLTGPGVNSTNDSTIWSEAAGPLSMLAREMEQAPGLPAGTLFQGMDPPAFNAAGEVAFVAALTGAGVNSANNISMWSESAGGLGLYLREGDAAPGLPVGTVFSAFPITPALNTAGESGYRASLLIGAGGVTAANDLCVWSDAGGGLSLVARESDQAIDTPAGVLFSAFDGDVAINAAGQVAFGAFVVGAGITPANDGGIWSEGGGSGLALIAREGDPAPDTPSGVVFSQIATRAVLNASGHVAMFSLLSGTGVTTENDSGIWSQGSGSGLALVAREGDQAAGTPAGVLYGAFHSSPAINAQGRVAFCARLAGPGVTTDNDTGIWIEDTAGGSISMRAREGDPAPGTPAGVVFSSLFNAPALNATGRIAFVASLEGVGVDSSNDLGLWSADANGDFTLVAREGDLFDVGGGDLRVISGIGLLIGRGGEDGRASGLNDAGELAFRLIFDGVSTTSGIFVAALDDVVCEGDVDGDGQVGLGDLATLLSNFGQTGATYSDGDLNGDGSVDLSDLALLLVRFGASC